MNQNHCVPTWNNPLEDVGHPIPPPQPPPPPPLSSRVLTSQSMSASLSAGPDTSMLDYEMAELTWENGQLTMHGLGLPRVPSKSSLADATLASGMLESVVNQAYHHNNNNNKSTPAPARVGGACEHHNNDDDVVPWYGPTTPAPVPVSLDALVPNNSTNNNNNGMGCSTRVGSCSAAVTRVPLGSDWSVSLSASRSNSRRKRQAEDTCEQLRSMNNNNGHTSTSFAASPENTKTFTVDDHDSASQSRSQRERGDEEENQKQGTAKSTGSTKRSRAAAVHNQSERKRRDKINQRMKTLQKLVPNSNKTDKASMLDEAIEYLKNLQAQVQMLSRVSLPSLSMMMPLAFQHQLQMSSMMAPIGLGMGMGMGMGMDHANMGMNPLAGRPNLAGINPSHLMNMAAAYNMPLSTSDHGTSANAGAYNMPQGALVSTDPLSTYLACQSHPMTMDAYSKMAAIYQQHLQQQTQQQQRQNHQQPGGPSSNL